MYEGETERIPRVTDPGKSDLRDKPGSSAHHHHHGPPPPASRRVRTLVAMLLVPFALAAVVGTVLLFPFGDGPETDGGAGRPVDGVVTATETGPCNSEVQVGEEQPDAPQCLVVRVRMTDGEAPGQEISAIVPQEPSTPRFAVDDDVVLSYGGSDPRESSSYQLVDFQRDLPLALLAGWFAVAVLVMGRWQGLRALLGLGLSMLVLVFFVLPAIIAGENPLLVAVCGAGVIMFAVLYLTHGFSARTSTAVLGTMVALTMIGVLSTLWASLTKLTGLDDETATLVGLLDAPIDTRGLLLAGVVIGALGVLDDVTVTQTSAVWELRAANPSLTKRQLYASALRIGRDHVASAVNTLVMAYAGAALPLLLYSSISGVGLGSILTSQSIAQELVRTLVGSIGLVAAVPITTALATAVATQEQVAGSDQPRRDRATKGQPGRATAHPDRIDDRPGMPGAVRNGHGPRPAPGDASADAPTERRRRVTPAGQPVGQSAVDPGRTAGRQAPAEAANGDRTRAGRGLPGGAGRPVHAARGQEPGLPNGAASHAVQAGRGQENGLPSHGGSAGPAAQPADGQVGGLPRRGGNPNPAVHAAHSQGGALPRRGAANAAQAARGQESALPQRGGGANNPARPDGRANGGGQPGGIPGPPARTDGPAPNPPTRSAWFDDDLE
ncbi:YibE/F family protein [Actinophytocola sediminis]